MVEFSNIERDENGEPKLVKVRTITMAQISACDHRIMTPVHYRPDGTCKCDDEEHTAMAKWGYEWDHDRGLWMMPDDDDEDSEEEDEEDPDDDDSYDADEVESELGDG